MPGLWLLLLIVLSVNACGRVHDTKPESDAAGVEFVRELDQMVPGRLESTATPGAAVAVVANGKILAVRGYGMASLKDSIDFTAETSINVASVSKSVSTWGMLTLARLGQIELNDPVNEHLTSWQIPGDRYDPSAVTIHRLLNHTGGLGTAAVPWFAPDDVPTVSDALRRGEGMDENVAMVTEPGTKWSYSGGGYMVLELMLEDVTGESFEGYMQRSIFRPLSMSSSAYSRIGDAVGYDENGKAYPPRQFAGTSAAGLRTTAADFALFLREYHRVWNDVSDILPRASLDAMINGAVGVELDGVEGAAYGFGHGVHETSDGSVLIYHSGGNPGFRSWFIVEPESGNGIWIAVNSDNGVPVIRSVRDLWAVHFEDDLPPLY